MTLDKSLNLIIGQFRSTLSTIKINLDRSGVAVVIDVKTLAEARSLVDAPEEKKDELLLSALKDKLFKEAFVKESILLEVIVRNGALRAEEEKRVEKFERCYLIKKKKDLFFLGFCTAGGECEVVEISKESELGKYIHQSRRQLKEMGVTADSALVDLVKKKISYLQGVSEKSSFTASDACQLTSSALVLTLTSKEARLALYDYFLKMGDLYDKKYEYADEEICPLSLYAPRDPCYLYGADIAYRYERVELEMVIDNFYKDKDRNKVAVIDPISRIEIKDPRIVRDNKKRQQLRMKYPFPLADVLSDYYALFSNYDEYIPLIISAPHFHSTDMTVSGNPLIYEFRLRYAELYLGSCDRSPNGMRDSIYEILQDYQRDRRSQGCLGDWSLKQVVRPGLWEHKEVILGGFFSRGLIHIGTTRKRLFIVDGLVDTEPDQDVERPIKGTLLYELESDKNMQNYTQLKQVFELFLKPSRLLPVLEARAKRAEIRYSDTLTTANLIGDGELSEFLQFVVMVLRQFEATQEYAKMPTHEHEYTPTVKSFS